MYHTDDITFAFDPLETLDAERREALGRRRHWCAKPSGLLSLFGRVEQSREYPESCLCWEVDSPEAFSADLVKINIEDVLRRINVKTEKRMLA